MPIYGQKRLCAGFEIGFTAFAVLFLEHGGYYGSIGGTIAKIRAKMFIRRQLNWVYGITRSIIRTFEVVLC